jgi:hypothetical protein
VSEEERFNRISSEIDSLRYTIICLVIVVIFTTITNLLLLVTIGGPSVVQALGGLIYLFLAIAIIGALVVFTWRCLRD